MFTLFFRGALLYVAMIAVMRALGKRQLGELEPYELAMTILLADLISVIFVFKGEDEDIRSAKLVYGNDFARIQSVDQLAETVGKLILSCIRNL